MTCAWCSANPAARATLHGDDFFVHLRLDKILGRRAEVRSIEALDAKGAVTSPIAFNPETQGVGFFAEKTDFAYRVNLK